MAAAVHPVRHTRAGFSSLERPSNVRHEYLDGALASLRCELPVDEVYRDALAHA